MARKKEEVVMLPVVNSGRSERIDNFLKERLAPRYYAFWEQFTSQFPLPFDKPSSSSGKYHLNTSGEVDSLTEHTMDLLQFVDRLSPIFGDSKEESHYDLLLLAAGLHDLHKYGEDCSRKHTTKEHGVITANLVVRDGEKMGLSEYETKTLMNLILYHDGRWNSTNKGFKPISFTQLQLLLHIADYASSRRILKFE